MAQPLPEALCAPITTLDEGKAWVRALVDAHMDFHLEDDPGDIEIGLTGESLFAAEDVPLIRQRVDDLYALDWEPDHECPIGYLLEYAGDEDGEG